MKTNNRFEFWNVFNVLEKHQWGRYVFENYLNNECKTPWTFVITCGGFVTFPQIREHFNIVGFATKDQAEKFRKSMIDSDYYSEKVAVVTRNTDFTEGRGPNIFHKVFMNPADAHEYIVRQPGIYSSHPQGSPKIHFGVTVDNKLYGSFRYDGYEIILTDLQ